MLINLLLRIGRLKKSMMFKIRGQKTNEKTKLKITQSWVLLVNKILRRVVAAYFTGSVGKELERVLGRAGAVVKGLQARPGGGQAGLSCSEPQAQAWPPFCCQAALGLVARGRAARFLYTVPVCILEPHFKVSGRFARHASVTQL
ncbi:hypothetical protein chiPu_0008519 [Chiloscyllium punctatum]|uniref:Uncharacterized protein n=1 Tax=Chiloscyllium punctatum TaxID=137246 RepID=A0A401SI98_CHIPU|nr:hypothetical protein [Chiloscyllium punctatum]